MNATTHQDLTLGPATIAASGGKQIMKRALDPITSFVFVVSVLFLCMLLSDDQPPPACNSETEKQFCPKDEQKVHQEQAAASAPALVGGE